MTPPDGLADGADASGPYLAMTTTSATSAAAMNVTMAIRERRMIPGSQWQEFLP